MPHCGPICLIKAERAIASEALVAEGADLCSWYIMISEMPGPIYVRLSGIVMGRWGDVLGQKKFPNVDISVCVMTLSALRTVALRHIYLISWSTRLGPL